MAKSRSSTQVPAKCLILDSGAVIALAHRDQRARAVLNAAWEAGVEVSIPSVVVAETVRGSSRDAPVNQVIKSVGEVSPADERSGRVAGELLGAARSAATVDALVVASAVALGGGVVFTGDPSDIGALASRNPEVTIRAL